MHDIILAIAVIAYMVAGYFAIGIVGKFIDENYRGYDCEFENNDAKDENNDAKDENNDAKDENNDAKDENK